MPDHQCVNGECVHSRRSSNEVDRRVDVCTGVNSERKLGDGCGVASVETLRLLQLDAGVARIVNHLMSDSDCKVDPAVTRRSVKNDVLALHASVDLVRSLSNPQSWFLCPGTPVVFVRSTRSIPSIPLALAEVT